MDGGGDCQHKFAKCQANCYLIYFGSHGQNVGNLYKKLVILNFPCITLLIFLAIRRVQSRDKFRNQS